MSVTNYIYIVVFAALLNTATSTLLCYDCDAGRECEDPILYNVRSVNCNQQYPDALQNNGQLVCLSLHIKTISGSKGFNMYKTGYYRGCKVINNGEESHFCHNLKTTYADRLIIKSCRYCNTTRCIP